MAKHHVMGWSTLATLQLHVSHANRGLVVQLVPIGGTIEWMILAAEVPDVGPPVDLGPLGEVGARIAASVERVFADHAHKLVGRSRGLAEGIMAAEKYARAWQRGASPEDCACGEIGAAAERPAQASDAAHASGIQARDGRRD